MARNPYERFKSSDLILRDELAVDRTILANERTLLSYVRTGLAFAVTGAAAIKFFVSLIPLLLGAAMMFLGFAVAAFGVWRFQRVARHISTCRRRPAGQADGETHSPPERETTEQSAEVEGREATR